jgi:hypothetical protein
MTSFGILMPAIRPPHTVKPGDDRTMQIRARRAKDLDILRAEYMRGDLGETRHTPDKDYEYRAYCTPHAFAIAMMRLILEIDYLKFKPTTHKRYQDHELHGCYNTIWAAVLRELSTPKHQYEYWNNGSSSYVAGGKGAGKQTGKGGKHAAGKTATGWSPDGWSPDGSHSTRAIGPGHFEDDDDWGSMDDLLQLHRAGGHHSHGHRNTSATRDEYLPEVGAAAGAAVDTVELAPLVDDEDLFLAEENKLLDALYAEIDAITHRGPLDHSQCEHPKSDNARARCRRKRRRTESTRIAEIRAAIDATYDESTLAQESAVLVGEIDGRQ